MESVVVDAFDSPGMESGPGTPVPALYPPAEQQDKSSSTVSAAEAEGEKKPQIVLSEAQRRIVVWLNTLPGLKKELAFIHPAANSHGVIISRDVKRFPAHREGEGLIRHWADHFIV